MALICVKCAVNNWVVSIVWGELEMSLDTNDLKLYREEKQRGKKGPLKVLYVNINANIAIFTPCSATLALMLE